MSISVVQTAVQTANVTTSPQAVSATFPAPVTSGNLIVAIAGAFCDGTPGVGMVAPGQPVTFSGNAGFSWTTEFGLQSHLGSGLGDAGPSANPYLYLISGQPAYTDANAGGDTVTITVSNLGNQSDVGSSQLVLACFELSGQTPEYPPIFGPTDGIASQGGSTTGPLPPSPYTLSSRHTVLVGLAVARTHIPTIDGASTSIGSGSAGVLQYRAAYKTGVVGNDAVYFSLPFADILMTRQVAIILPPIRSSRPPGPFARIPASSFTR